MKSSALSARVSERRQVANQRIPLSVAGGIDFGELAVESPTRHFGFDTANRLFTILSDEVATAGRVSQ
jgi:hypothetical protein